MKSGSSLWKDDVGSTNSSSFSAEPSGYYNYTNSYFAFKNKGCDYWTSYGGFANQVSGITVAYMRGLFNYTNQIYRDDIHIKYGYCIRCIKD